MLESKRKARSSNYNTTTYFILNQHVNPLPAQASTIYPHSVTTWVRITLQEASTGRQLSLTSTLCGLESPGEEEWGGRGGRGRPNDHHQTPSTNKLASTFG